MPFALLVRVAWLTQETPRRSGCSIWDVQPQARVPTPLWRKQVHDQNGGM